MSNCDLCKKNNFKLFNFSCKQHFICLNCVYESILTSNFNNLNLREFFLICPECKNGEFKLLNEDLINDLNELIENQKFSFQKCEKHNKNLNNFCEKCNKYFCDECLINFHNDYFPEHIIKNNIISKKSTNNFQNYEEFKIFLDNKKNEIFDELNNNNIFFINQIDEIIKKFQEFRNEKKKKKKK